MDEKVLHTLDSIDKQLSNINKKLNLICKNYEEPTEEKEKSEEDEIMDFLEDITKELGLENKVTIKKVVIK